MLEWIGGTIIPEYGPQIMIGLFIVAGVCWLLAEWLFDGRVPFLNAIAEICIYLAIFIGGGLMLVGLKG